MSVQFKINGRNIALDVPDDTPLLWVIRDELNLKGTKFGCGIGQCGACTVHVDGIAMRSCTLPLSVIDKKSVTTIEGLDHPLQAAWVKSQAPQCGYCQSGQMMQAAILIADYPNPTDADINRVMNGNLCRCMAYKRIREAIKIAAEEINSTATKINQTGDSANE
ncbi:MAG: isoquinoline 1-oxidoreductase alpha subunit [Flavobacterium sp.]|jgi:isoquinoline 1-oxidoreductase alpha subunit